MSRSCFKFEEEIDAVLRVISSIWEYSQRSEMQILFVWWDGYSYQEPVYDIAH
jgi:hypothetical protein